MITISKHNETFLNVQHDQGVEFDMNLGEYFSFFVPNYQFDPLYKRDLWDGKIRLYKKKERLLYLNLLPQLIEYLQKNKCKYNITFDPDVTTDFNTDKFKQFIKKIQPKLTARDYQENLVKGALYLKRMVAVSPTSSGKTLSLFLIVKYLLSEKKINSKILIIVPSISLVSQMTKDFAEYDTTENNIQNTIHSITSGVDKDDDKKQLYISTWQSVFKMPEEYFQKFECLIVDEVHRAKANSIKTICENCTNAHYRIGVTGTMHEWNTHRLVIIGLLGNVFNIISTKNLIDQKILSPIRIYNLIFNYPDSERMMLDSGSHRYQHELNYILQHTKRNRMILYLISQLKGNSMLLFTRIKQGEWFRNALEKHFKGKKKILYVDGKTSLDDREWIREEMERDDNHILIASTQCFSEGINIKQIHNIILTSGGKSKIRLMQSIGRGLRTHENKKTLKVIDIIDNLTYNGRENWMMIHYKKRKRYYDKEEFPNYEKTYDIK